MEKLMECIAPLISQWEKTGNYNLVRAMNEVIDEMGFGDEIWACMDEEDILTLGDATYYAN